MKYTYNMQQDLQSEGQRVACGVAGPAHSPKPHADRVEHRKVVDAVCRCGYEACEDLPNCQYECTVKPKARCSDIDEEVKRLYKEITTLKMELNEWRTRHAMLVRQNDALIKENQRLHKQISELQWLQENERLRRTYNTDNGGWG